jgi:hypothetical protein
MIYAVGQTTIGWFGNFYNRYGVNFFIAAFCLAALLVDDLLRRGRTGQATAWIVVLPALSLLVNLTATANPPPKSPLVNREPNFKAGALIQEIVAPTPLSVSTTEMNSFGLAVRDRQVLDYWGYSNPAIAQSPTCNIAHNRSAPPPSSTSAPTSSGPSGSLTPRSPTTTTRSKRASPGPVTSTGRATGWAISSA